jgi:hypothetical protein
MKEFQWRRTLEFAQSGLQALLYAGLSGKRVKRLTRKPDYPTEAEAARHFRR